MKKYLIALVPVTLLAVLGLRSTSHSAEKNIAVAYKYTEDDIKPTETQKKVEELVTQILGNYHYRRVPLNDSLSSKIFDNYIKELDGNKMNFTKQDIDDFEKFRYTIDDQLQSGDLTAAYQIYNVYRKRAKERFTFVASLLNKPMDFKIDEVYSPDREKSSWANNKQELDEIWRKAIKSTLLDWKISGKADSSAVKDLKERYTRSEKYFDKTKSEDVFQQFMNSFTESVDPHTNYMIPKAAAQFNQEMAQSFEGIGATLRLEGDYVTIMELITGGPAYKSKALKPKDRIVGVAQGDNGAFVDIVGWMTDDAVKLIKGPKSTVVRLKILPGDAAVGAMPKEIRLVREKIKLEDGSAKKDVLLLSNNGKPYKLGLITLPVFYRDFEGVRKGEGDFKSTSADVKKFLIELKAEKVDGVILDLRNNGGGSLVEAVSLTGLFIPQGPVVQRKHADGEISAEYDRDPSVTYDGPLGVLVNRFSASASEIFAGAIQDYKRGIIIGEQTYGKGTVQTLVDLSRFLKSEPDNVGQLKITMEKFYRITGSSTQHKGVTPDIELPSGFSAAEYGESSQPSALPWDMIASTKYTPSQDVNEQIVSKLKKKYEERLKTEADLKKLVSDFDYWKKAKERKTISLQEDKRRKEIDEQKKRNSQEINNDLGDVDTKVEVKTDSVSIANAKEKALKERREKDAYLKETERILTDYIFLAPSNGIKLTQNNNK
ncbi:carboxy terminal-processing peptidase [Flectobacillus major]|jgi:carboxyl-terminal processing protease|uniref:carboxy terminal-processing peptidase n=1 Tax=Flectobacillus major TaxID=103 RepID=UPI0003F7A204|nr:carboxy terminal-processing peptidase [Flectobacillus major]